MSKVTGQRIVIFESPKIEHFFLISWYLYRKIKVFVVEPSSLYHRSFKKIRFFPPPFPSYINRWLNQGRIDLIKAQQLNTSDIYISAADRAVAIVEKVFPFYQKDQERFFKHIHDVLNDEKARDVFKMNFCDHLAEFLSMNILLHRVSKIFEKEEIFFFPEREIGFFSGMKHFFSLAGQSVLEHKNINFSFWSYLGSFFSRIKDYLSELMQLSIRVFLSALLWRRPRNSLPFRKLYNFLKDGKSNKLSPEAIFSSDRKKFFCGIAIVSPVRQLMENQRAADFLVDNHNILSDEVAYFPILRVTSAQKKKLSKISKQIFYIPRVFSYAGRFREWLKLLGLALAYRPFGNVWAIKCGYMTFDRYFKWQSILESVQLKHFVTHCDFGEPHIGRNIALKQAGVQTWYFTDSMNHTGNWREDINLPVGRHPLWTYLHYDHFVTWNHFLGRFYHREHPESFKAVHVVGCLWSSHIQPIHDIDPKFIANFCPDRNKFFVMAVFDTTYSCNGITPYPEGIAFAEDILKLVDTFEDVHILFKEKKTRQVHSMLDPNHGPKLVELYERMSKHSRITFVPSHLDSSKLISLSDLSISFPFTSTTFEALSAHRRAIWHDPWGNYQNTVYGKNPRVSTHGFSELKKFLLDIKTNQEGFLFPSWSDQPDLMDPYQDGNAIERFRQLLKSFSSGGDDLER